MCQSCSAFLVPTGRANSTYTTTFRQVIHWLFLLALPLAICGPGSAASLQGKVAEIIDAGTIVVVSANHPVKVKLVAIAVPEKEQSYSSIARQHLSDLILDKYVVVRYSELRESFLVGQVLCGNMDVGAQMIRDGVAWYDKLDEKRLSEVEQQIYAESQEAAHTERRGLWQDESPIPPWDFRRAQLASANSNAPSLVRLSPTTRRSQAGLSSEDLIGGVIGPGSITGKPDLKPISGEGSPGRWMRYQPADHHFSILAPSDGIEITYPILDGQAKAIEVHYVVGNSDGNLYFLMWAKGSNGNSTDASTTADAVKGLTSSINRTSERMGFVVIASPGRTLKLSGYVGRQYLLNGGPIKGVVQILSKQIGIDRELFVLCVLNGPESEKPGVEFLNSFKLE